MTNPAPIYMAFPSETLFVFLPDLFFVFLSLFVGVVLSSMMAKTKGENRKKQKGLASRSSGGGDPNKRKKNQRRATDKTEGYNEVKKSLRRLLKRVFKELSGIEPSKTKLDQVIELLSNGDKDINTLLTIFTSLHSQEGDSDYFRQALKHMEDILRG